MLDLVELFTHWHAGRSQVQLSESLGIDRKTVRKYLAPAVAAGIGPGTEPLTAPQWSELIGGWFPELSDPAARALTWPLIEPHRDQIKTNRSLAADRPSCRLCSAHWRSRPQTSSLHFIDQD